MAAGANLHANQTSVRLKEFVTALWGIMNLKGPSCFRGTLPKLREHKDVQAGSMSGPSRGLTVKANRWTL